MKNYFEIECDNCLQCCYFHIFVNEYKSFRELYQAFCFSKELCDTFFKKDNKKYYIDKQCIQYLDNKCTIHNTNRLPFTCALYPLFLVTENNKINLVIDLNCPQSAVVIKKFNTKKSKEKIKYVISEYQKFRRAYIFPVEALLDCGYDLKILAKNYKY